MGKAAGVSAEFDASSSEGERSAAAIELDGGSTWSRSRGAPLFTLNKLRRMDIPSTLRVTE